jgi:hypothetical protein
MYFRDSERPATVHTTGAAVFEFQVDLETKKQRQFHAEKLTPRDHYIEILIAIATFGYLLL